jgi:hypothetical protein
MDEKINERPEKENEREVERVEQRGLHINIAEQRAIRPQESLEQQLREVQQRAQDDTGENEPRDEREGAELKPVKARDDKAEEVRIQHPEEKNEEQVKGYIRIEMIVPVKKNAVEQDEEQPTAHLAQPI